MQQRKQWGARTEFILAAIGAAIYFGNTWRFPYAAYENGDNTFSPTSLPCSALFWQHCIPEGMENKIVEHYNNFLEQHRQLMTLKIRYYYAML